MGSRALQGASFISTLQLGESTTHDNKLAAGTLRSVSPKTTGFERAAASSCPVAAGDPAFSKLPRMQDQRGVRERSRIGAIPRRLKAGMSELGTGCMSPIAGRAGDGRRVSPSIAWSREDARFFLEAGAGRAFLALRRSISLFTRVTAAARRLRLALGAPPCEAVTPEVGICPRSSCR
jgi:hypothetical protein